MRYYLINQDITEVDLVNCTDLEFMDLAEEIGSVYSQEGFEQAFNQGEINVFTEQLRILKPDTPTMFEGLLKYFEETPKNEILVAWDSTKHLDTL